MMPISTWSPPWAVIKRGKRKKVLKLERHKRLAAAMERKVRE
jgi:hypothetical protein